MARLENAALPGAVDCEVWWGAKGKIPKGNIQPRRPEDHCYGSERWLALACSSVPGAPRAPGSAGTGQSCQFNIRQQWRLFFISPDSSSHRCWLSLWPISVKWWESSKDPVLAFQGDLDVESWLSHCTVRKFWTNYLTSLHLFSLFYLFFKSGNEDTYLIGSCLTLVGSTYM